MTTQSKQAPVDTLRDGALKISIWKNHSEKGSFYTYTIARTYTDGETAEGKPNYQDSNSFSGTDALKLGVLLQATYQRVNELRQTYAEAKKRDA